MDREQAPKRSHTQIVPKTQGDEKKPRFADDLQVQKMAKMLTTVEVRTILKKQHELEEEIPEDIKKLRLGAYFLSQGEFDMPSVLKAIKAPPCEFIHCHLLPRGTHFFHQSPLNFVTFLKYLQSPTTSSLF